MKTNDLKIILRKKIYLNVEQERSSGLSRIIIFRSLS